MKCEDCRATQELLRRLKARFERGGTITSAEREWWLGTIEEKRGPELGLLLLLLEEIDR